MRALDFITKRLADVIFSLTGLVVFSPLFLFAALAIKLDSKGPVFFLHKRLGYKKKPFYMIKFRTMVENAVQFGPEVTISQDARVTRVGRILRKLKIDELPQLINVLLGQMSIVGPRPQSFSYIPYYPETDLEAILGVRPGITGPTQLWLRHEEEILSKQEDPIRFYIEDLLPLKIDSDVRYASNRSILLDARITLETIGAVLKVKPPSGVHVKTTHAKSNGNLERVA
jgi:lipopolysaccharide/colanic/teichoic acid biosynthesis glycosyltransferase